MNIKKIAAGIAGLLLATSASAEVTFDPATGQGFVGKGDVQAAFGWNNATLQANVTKIAFNYESDAVYEVTCEMETKKSTMVKTFKRSRSNSLSVQPDPRVKKQVTGFYLLGYADEIESTKDGSEICPAPENDKQWQEVSRILISETPATLKIAFGPAAVTIWQ